MKIPGAIIAPPKTLNVEQGPGAIHQPPLFTQRAGSVASSRRAVKGVEQATVIYLQDRMPLASNRLFPNRYVERAMAVYESIEQLKPRDGLRAISGIDDFA